MKAKYILTALCLPALFAACSEEEFAVENGIEGKATVNLRLSATYGSEDDADTKMVNQNGTFLWDNTDVLGACLLGASGNNIYSNNKFVNNLTSPSAKADFTTDATTVVGDYMFYYKYDTKMTNDLSGIGYSLKEPQEYDPTGEKMMKNNFMISPRIKVDGNEPGGLTLPLTMRSIYAYGTLNLKLAEVINIGSTPSPSTTSVNVQKIIISYTSNVEKNGIIDMSKMTGKLAVNLSASYLKSLREGDDARYKGKTDAELTTILLAEADKVLTAQSDNYTDGNILDLTTVRGSGTANKIGQVSISCISDATPNGVALSKTGTFSTRVLLPTTAQAGTAVEVKVYTDKGVYTKNIAGNNRIKAGHTVNLANINRSGVETALTMDKFTPSSDVNAISEADFIASMAQFAGQGEQTIEVTVGDFELTPAAIAAIPSTVTVKFMSGAKFKGDMTLKKMTLAENQSYKLNGGNITIDPSVTFESDAKVEIAEETTVSVKEQTTTPENAQYEVKGGTLTINNVNAQGKAVATQMNSIKVNKGVVNVSTPVDASLTLTEGIVNNNATISAIASIGAKGTLENKGTVTTVTANSGVINNYGTLTTVTTNSKTINQKDRAAVITNCATNEGTIVTVAYSQTTVGTNNGEIVFVEGARIKTTDGSGDVTYNAPADMKATDFSDLSAAITKIVFGSDFTYNHGTNEVSMAALPDKVTKLVFHGNLTLGQNWNAGSVTEISFVGATANVSGKKTFTGNTTAFTLTVGVAANQSAGVEAVATDLYIAPSTTITKLTAAPTIQGGARVWNDGIVKGTTDAGAGWSGNAIDKSAS